MTDREMDTIAGKMLDQLSWPVAGDTLSSFKNQQLRNKRIVIRMIKDIVIGDD